MEYESSLALQIAMGLGLASCAGLRAFLPLFLMGVAARLGWVTLGSPFGWLGSWPALVVFGVAVVAEFLADKIPVIDHLLDVLHLLVKPAAGALLAVAVLTRLDPLEATVLGILTGGGTAGAVHAAKAKLRMLSSFTTAGLANPLLSLAEDGAALVGFVAAILVPFLLAFVVAVSLCSLVIVFVRFRRRVEKVSETLSNGSG